jgi:hypothetical protein
MITLTSQQNPVLVNPEHITYIEAYDDTVVINMSSPTDWDDEKKVHKYYMHVDQNIKEIENLLK